jgi:phage repressor protein C with HTH and peptisase S24 domain
VAVLKKTGWSATEWARQTGATATTITRFMRKPDASMPTWETMRKLASKAPIPPPQIEVSAEAEGLHIGNMPDQPIETGLGPQDYELITALDIRPGMGGGAYEGIPNASKVLFPRRLVRDQLGARPDDLRVVEVEGPSMLPMLESGDQVLVNINKRNPSQPGIFCLWDGFGIVCKLVERVPQTDPARLRILSANTAFSPYEIMEDEANIVGRVVWFARRL